MSKFSSKRLDQIWEKGGTIRRKDFNLYRSDICGNTLYYHSYRKDTQMGWSVDHSKPVSKGGLTI